MKSLDIIKDEIKHNGFAIIPNLITPNEITEYKEEFNNWYLTACPNVGTGILSTHQCGHQRFAWKLRLNRKVQHIFQYLWNTDDLVTGFDGCCFIKKEVTNADHNWTHIDQTSNPDSYCYQSFVSLTSNKERTFVAYEGSNQLFREYAAEYLKETNPNTIGYRIEPEFLDKIKNTRKAVEVNAGDMVIWDSRTFHQNQFGKPESEERLVQYISFMPRENDTDHDKRLQYFNERITTSHWAYPMSGKHMTTDYTKSTRPRLDDLMERIEEVL
jgi:hypothetical protein